MSDNRPDKFEILRRLAVDGSAGDEIDRAAQKALKLTVPSPKITRIGFCLSRMNY